MVCLREITEVKYTHNDMEARLNAVFRKPEADANTTNASSSASTSKTKKRLLIAGSLVLSGAVGLAAVNISNLDPSHPPSTHHSALSGNMAPRIIVPKPKLTSPAAAHSHPTTEASHPTTTATPPHVTASTIHSSTIQHNHPQHVHAKNKIIPHESVLLPHPIPVCAVLFTWYGYNGHTGTWTGGDGTSHWNDSPYAVVKDVPPGGYYSSMSEIPIQLRQMASAGINCAIVNWDGPGYVDLSKSPLINPKSEDGVINQATAEVFRAARSIPGFKVVIMVDAFTSAQLSNQDYHLIYAYVNSHFYYPYASEILKWQGNPLLMWFNPMDPPPYPGITSRVTGNNNNDISPGWWFWRVPSPFINGMGGTFTDPCGEGYCGTPTPSPDGFVSVTPGYDDQALYDAGSRKGWLKAGPSLRLYAYEWEEVTDEELKYKDIELVMDTTDNEESEMSGINLLPGGSLAITKEYIDAFESAAR